MTKTKSVVFTGHRRVQDEHLPLIHQSVESVCQTAASLFVGGAAGADTIVLLHVCAIVESGGAVPDVWLVVPSKVEDQPEMAQFAFRRASALLGDRVHLVEMGLPYNGESLKARNREMIHRAIELGDPEVLAYFTKIWKSGTYSAMCYAKKMAVPVVQIVS